MMEPWLDPAACRIRQDRLRDWMAEAGVDLAVVVAAEHVQYLTGQRFDQRFAPLAAVHVAGPSLLVAPDKPVAAAVDDVRTYEAKWRSTLRQDQRATAAAVLADWLASRPAPRRVAVEWSAAGPCVVAAAGGGADGGRRARAPAAAAAEGSGRAGPPAASHRRLRGDVREGP